MDDCRNCQTSTATPAEPGDLSWEVRVAECFEYAGHTFNKEYVERGAFIFFGILGAVLAGVYYAGRYPRG
jgi:hypothetical protein